MSSTDAGKPEPTVFPERAEAFDLSSFACPRCQTQIAAEAYGPCPDCVAELKDRQRTEARGQAAVAYEPKMNVTPNAVALKDD